MGRMTASSKNPGKGVKVNESTGSGALNPSLTATTNAIDHSHRTHALLSASGSHRWMACTPSAVLSEKYGEFKTSPYAKEGELAHEISELYLRRDVLQCITEKQFDKELSEKMASEFFSDEILDKVPIYTDYCEEQYNTAKMTYGSAILEVEQRLDLTAYIPEGFGTGDCIIISDDTLEIIDLKYGKGVIVKAEQNPQLMIYGLGAYNLYKLMYDIKKIRMTIVQPRVANGISSFEMSVEDLLKWAETELMPKAKLASEGKGSLKEGDHCKFCPVKDRCRQLAEANLKLAQHEFCDPSLLKDEEIAEILEIAPRISEWAESVHAYALDQAINKGKHWNGFKLVAGKSNRKWIDDPSAIESAILREFPSLSPKDYTRTDIVTIGAMEKLVGKKEFTKISDVVIKPEGKPTLVSLTDPRPEIETYISAAEEFAK